MKARYGDEDCIAAPATLPGKSALAIIRLSGSGCIERLAPLFSRPEKLKAADGYTLVHGVLSRSDLSHCDIDEVVIAVYRAPHSYTGEETAEISCHGGIAIVHALMEALKGAGFREALPGEFSFRAFKNGKMDLTRAEAVMEMVAASGEKARGAAYSRLAGSLEKDIDKVKTRLTDALAELELSLDYPAGETEAGDDELTRTHIREACTEALPRLKALAASYKRERLYAQGALVVIAGRPNAGKSSLFNLLLKEERSLVTPVSGTTRDWIEASLLIRGIPIRLVDTAGLHELGAGLDADGGEGQAAIEKLGIERSRRLVRAADLVLYLLDGEQGETPEDKSFIEDAEKEGLPLLVLWNKADLSTEPTNPTTGRGSTNMRISALTGLGMEELTTALAAKLEETAAPGMAPGASVTGIGTERQKALVDEALLETGQTLAALEGGETEDLIAESLRASVNALGEITGEVTTADLLEKMFSQFCVGK